MKEMEEAGNERACYSFFAWSKIATFTRIVICNADEKKSCKVIREKYVIIGLDKDFLVTTINISFCPFLFIFADILSLHPRLHATKHITVKSKHKLQPLREKWLHSFYNPGLFS